MQNFAPQADQSQGYLQAAVPQQPVQQGQGYLQGVQGQAQLAGGQNVAAPGQQQQQQLSPNQVNQNDPREVWSAVQQELTQVAASQGPAAAEHMYQLVVKPNFEKKYGQNLPSTYTGIPPEALPQMNQPQNQQMMNGKPMNMQEVNNAQQVNGQPSQQQSQSQPQLDPQTIRFMASSDSNNINSILAKKRNQSDALMRSAQQSLLPNGDVGAAADEAVNGIDYNLWSMPNYFENAANVGKDMFEKSTPEEKAWIENYRTTMSRAERLFLSWVQSQSGAQVSDTEMKRRQKAFLSKANSPSEAKAEAEQLYKEINVNLTARQIMAMKGLDSSSDALKNGFSSVQAQVMGSANSYMERLKQANPNLTKIQAVQAWKYKVGRNGL